MSQLFYLLDLQKNLDDENTFLNRYWFYNSTSTDQTASSVITSFAFNFLPVIRAVQSNEIQHTALYCKEVLDGTDEVLGTLTNANGGRNADAHPDFTQYSFYFKAIGPLIKRGGKRITGVNDADVGNNVVTNAALLSLLASLAATYLTGLPIGSAFVTHVITRYFPNVPSYLITPLIGAVYRKIATQRSRIAGAANAGLGFTGVPTTEQDSDVEDFELLATSEAIAAELALAYEAKGLTVAVTELRRY